MADNDGPINEYFLSRDFVDLNRYVGGSTSSLLDEYILLIRQVQNSIVSTYSIIYTKISSDIICTRRFLEMVSQISRLQMSVLGPRMCFLISSMFVSLTDMITFEMCRVWLRDLSKELDPSAQLVGLDTNTSQAGPPQWLPSNVTIRQWDATTDVPSDLVGQFDIVNLRLFGLVIREDPAPVLRNLIKMLSMYSVSLHTQIVIICLDSVRLIEGNI